MKIIRIEKSPLKNKRLRAYLEDYSYIDFGLKNNDDSFGSTYIDHKDIKKRLNYWMRHYENKSERYLIDNFIMSPSLLSAYILWGPYPSIQKNINWLNHKLI
jgi:hypothetical protein